MVDAKISKMRLQAPPWGFFCPRACARTSQAPRKQEPGSSIFSGDVLEIALVSSTRNSSRESPANRHQEEEANCAQKLKMDNACQHGEAGGQSGDEESKNPEPALRHQCQAADKSSRNFRAAAT